MKISENKYISLSYDLNVGEGDDIELMEQATAEQPMEFIFGTNMMLDAFEKQIEGLEQGEEFTFQLTPDGDILMLQVKIALSIMFKILMSGTN